MKKPNGYQRRPVKNFFIKKDLQIRLIFKILISVIFTAIITTAVMAAVYYYKSGSGYFYFMSNDLMEDLQRQSILKTILPSLLIAEFVSIVLGFSIGLFSSRKFALPVYKIEQWLDKIIKGEFGTKIFFREKEEFKEMTYKCNLLSDSLVKKFSSINEQLSSIEQSVSDPLVKEKISEVKKVLPDISSLR